jgi:exosortase
VFSRITKNTLRFLVTRPWLALLIVGHLPFVIRYFVELWPRQHYQFFPFAIIAFIFLFATRKSGQPEQWHWLAKILIGLDLVCLIAGCVLVSPWFFAVGLFCALTAWNMASQDEGYHRSLFYLAALPLMTIRLPLNYDEPVIMWLQRVTTSVASDILNRTGMLHYREGNVLNFPGKSFMVEEACSGVQSLFTILFLAALVFCLKRRSLIHGLCLLSSGLVLSGMMNILRVVTIAVAWDVNGTDLSTGWQHDTLGYVCLGLAAVMLLSADRLLEFLFAPMLDVRRHGGGSLYFNPLIGLWNKVLTVLPDADPKYAVVQSPRLLDSRVTEAEHREYAPAKALISPLLWFHFSLGGLESWFFSRSKGSLLAGTPFLLLAVVGSILISWQRHSSADPILSQYEDAFNQAVAAEDAGRQETYLRALASLRPSEPGYKYRLAQFMLSHGKPADGVRQIIALAPENRPGYADAHLWLAMQAVQPKPMLPMPGELVEQHLIHALTLAPRNQQAQLLLAQLYVQRKEWKLAERSLTEAAAIDPEHYLALAKLRKQLKRDPQDIAKATQLSLDHLTKQLSADRSSVKTRIALAETLVVAEQDAEARELLVAGLQQKDDPQLRRALNDLELMQADRRLKTSGLNRDAVIPMVLQALERDPSHLAAIQMLARLQAMGASFPAESLKPAIEHWEQAVKNSPDSVGARVLLGELLLASGDEARAIEVLAPAVEKQPDLRLELARLKLKSGSSPEATQLLDGLISEAKAKLAETPDDIEANSRLARTLLVAGRVSETKTLLAAFVKTPEVSAIPEPAELAALYGQACLAEFDQLTGYEGDPRSVSLRQLTPGETDAASTDQLLELLDHAYTCVATTNQAIDRLSRLSLSNHPAAVGAENMLRQLRLEGTHGATVLNLLGMHALMMNRCDKAKVWLEQANLQTRGRDPMILNNLATAIVRGGGDSKDRALQLANETLTLLPDHPDALSTRGEIYVAMERWPDAIADLTQSLQHRGKSAELHRLLEKAYLGINDNQMAADHGNRAKELEAAGILP